MSSMGSQELDQFKELIGVMPELVGAEDTSANVS